MVCKNCYYNNDSNSKFCAKCGKELQPEVVTENFANNNVQNNMQNNVNYSTVNYSPASAIAVLILSIMCCTNVIGIVFAILSLVEGGKINPAVANGNIMLAKQSLETAKKWAKYAWISLVVWILLAIIFYIVYFVLVLGLGILSAAY